MATINYCNYEIKGTLSTTGTITSGGIITAPGGNSSQWNTGYANSITGFSDSGSSTITLTLTQQDGGTLTTSFSNPQGTVTSVGISHAGNAFSTGSAVTTSGTLAITMAGSASQYVNGAGNLTTFPSIPQGDITAVVAGNKLTGGGTSGSVTLGLASNNISQWTNDSGYTTFAEPGIFSGGGTPTLASGVTGAEIRTLIGAGTSSSAGVTSVATGSGLTGGTITGTGTVSVDYAGSDSLIMAAGNASSPDADDFIIYGADSSGGGDTGKIQFTDVNVSLFNNDAGYTSNIGDITAVTAGTLLDGGGTSGAVTLNVDLSELTAATGDMISTDSFVITRANGTQFKTVPGLVPNNLFPNDAGYTTNVGDITAVVAGNKLTGGGTSGSVTLGLASNNVSQFTNDSGYTTNVGDITGVTAGTNLTGGGTSGTVTLNMATGGVGAGILRFFI